MQGSSPDRPGVARHGTVIAGRYRLDHPLATGGMARVWRATDAVLNRPVAVKILLDHLADDQSFVTRFRSEALAAARLAHPSVVSVYDTCSEDGLEAIVMELVDGTTLRRRLDTEGRLPAREAARIASRIAEALATAHRAGIIHRDIKPANVLLAESGRVVVTDFGIAKATENGDLTVGGQMLGTAKYLAPEQVEGTPIDGRADVYALGVVLFEMLCGQVPFMADTEAATALARLNQPPPHPRERCPDVPGDLDRITHRTLARQPADRWPDATSLARALGAVAAGRTAPPDPPAPGRTPLLPAGATAATTAPAPPSAELRRTSAPAGAPPPPSGPGFAEGEDVDDAWDAPPHPSASRRRAPALVLLAVVAAAVATIALLGWRLLTPGSEVVETTAVAFDPHGADQENDDQAPLAVDGDPDTAWATERYLDPDITLLKPGVGLVLDLDGPHRVRQVRVRTPTDGWSAQVFVVDGSPGDDFPAAAEPTATIDGHDGDATVAVDAEGDRVVVWITRTGADGVMAVAEVEVTARSVTPGPDPDADLVAAAQEGDRAALDRLLAGHQDTLYALCRRMLGDPTDAFDALQDSMIAIVRGLPRFDGRSKVSTWMHRVTTNCCLDELRRRRRRPTVPLPEHERAPHDAGPALDQQASDRADIEAALATLPPEFRAPVVLRDLLGHDYAEIADLLDIPAGTVRSRIARGRAALARELAGNQPPPVERPTLQP